MDVEYESPPRHTTSLSVLGAEWGLRLRWLLDAVDITLGGKERLAPCSVLLPLFQHGNLSITGQNEVWRCKLSFCYQKCRDGGWFCWCFPAVKDILLKKFSVIMPPSSYLFWPQEIGFFWISFCAASGSGLEIFTALCLRSMGWNEETQGTLCHIVVPQVLSSLCCLFILFFFSFFRIFVYMGFFVHLFVFNFVLCYDQGFLIVRWKAW